MLRCRLSVLWWEEPLAQQLSRFNRLLRTGLPPCAFSAASSASSPSSSRCSPKPPLLNLKHQVLNLELPPPPTYERELALRVSHTARVPYDARGWRSTSVTSLVNLTPGQLVRLHENHNWKGCGQPRGEALSNSAEGRVVRYSPSQRAWELEVGGIVMLVGHWWMEGAVRGHH